MCLLFDMCRVDQTSETVDSSTKLAQTMLHVARCRLLLRIRRSVSVVHEHWHEQTRQLVFGEAVARRRRHVWLHEFAGRRRRFVVARHRCQQAQCHL